MINRIKYNRIVSKFNVYLNKCEYNDLNHSFTCRYKGVILYSYSKDTKRLYLHHDNSISWFDQFSTDKNIMCRLLCDNFSKVYVLDLSSVLIYYSLPNGRHLLFKYDTEDKI